MLVSPPDLPPAARAATMAAWLAAGRSVHVFAMALFVASVLVLALVARPSVLAALPWFVALIAGVLEAWYALRIEFDQAVFANWADHWRSPTAQPDKEMAEFDASMTREQDASPRNLDSRLAGAARLLRRQLAFVLVQLIAVLVALILGSSHVV